VISFCFLHYFVRIRIQPNAETRERQLKAWKELILNYCNNNRVYTIDPMVFPYFKNDDIERQLSSDAIHIVIQYLIEQGNGEWEDGNRTKLRVIWKSIQSIANEIYDKINEITGIGTVYTIYELHSSDEFSDAPFFGVDPGIIRKALQLLESSRKVRGERLRELVIILI
jgi:ESCRT-II complex subunit VPS25